MNWYNYRDLAALGFRTGTPERARYPELYAAFVSELKRCVALVHKAGVIHVDLYASNIMWNQQASENSVQIKIVDWDVSHCLEEGDFAPTIKALLAKRVYAGEIVVPFGKSHDLNYVSVYEMPMEERHVSEWEALASGDKSRIDAAFRTLMRDRQAH